MLALWLCCPALLHCVQLEDGSGGATPTWGDAEQVHDDGSAPAVAIDVTGNAVAVWTQADGFWSSRFTQDDRWRSAELISSGGDALPTATVAMHGNGDAVAVWSQFFVRDNIFTNRYASGVGWGISHRIDDDNGNGFGPQVSIGSDDSVVAVWVQFDGTRDDVWSNRRTSQGGWGSPERIETNNLLDASGPQVAVDPSGNAMAVWAQSDGIRSDVWYNRYTPAGKWGSARRVENNNAGDAKDPQVGVDAEGVTVAVWSQSDGTTFDIWANRYTPTEGWGNPQRIEADGEGDATEPDVAVGPDGSAVAVWTQFDGANDDVRSNRYTPGIGWGVAERIETIDAGSAEQPRVAIDREGNAVAVWQQFDGTNDNVWSNHSTPSRGWGIAQRIDTDGTGIPSDPRIAMNPNGTAVAVWRVFGGTNHGVWSNRLE